MIEEDILEVGKLYLELILYIKETTGDEYFNFEALNIEKINQSLQESINNPKISTIVVEHDTEIVGFISGEIKKCFFPFSLIKKIGYISGCFIKEKYRKKGITNGMLKYLEKYFLEKGVKHIELNVLTLNYDSKKAWNKLGFDTFREQMRKRIQE